MPLEQTTAHHKVHEVGRVVHDVLQARPQVVTLLAAFYAVVEKHGEVSQRILVHSVDKSEVSDDEVEDGAASRHRAIPFTRLVDVLLGLLRLLHSPLDDARSQLRVVQRVDQHFIVQDVALRFLQQLQNFVLEIAQLPLVVGNTHNEAVFLLLEVWTLLPHDVSKQLVLKPLEGHGEVDESDLNADLRQIVRVRELRRDVELEVGVVVNVGVANPDHQAVSLLENLLLQDWLQGRVDFLANVLKDHWVPDADAVLQGPQESTVRKLQRSQAVLRLHGFDPLVRLPLGVDH